MTACVYRFGEFRLDLAARELWRNSEPHQLPRLTFDALVFLMEHRDRAVSRDELIDAVWGRSHVEDIQVTQLIMRLRRALGDDSHAPEFVGTVPGFGYRWIADTDMSVQAGASGESAPDEASGKADAPGATTRRHGLAAGLAVLAVLVLVFIAGRLGEREAGESPPLPRAPGEAVAVLPLEVRAPGNDAGWVRLGAMDLIIGRLSDAGMPTSPSDSVISALYTTAGSEDTERDDILRDVLGAGVLVHGTATRTRDGWMIALIAAGGDGERRRVESGPAEVIHAAGEAAELLLVALGRNRRVIDTDNQSLSELIQRVRAAILTLELDTAREILDEAPESLRNEPEARYQLAWIELRSGRIEHVDEITAELLENPGVKAQPRLRARVLTMRGFLSSLLEENISTGEPFYDSALAALEGEPSTPEQANALAARGLARAYRHDFQGAARDLGTARILFEAHGNRMARARVHEYLGHLELERRRLHDALQQFRAASEISDAFGHVDGLRTNLIATLNTQTQLLRWTEALATAERLLKLHDRIRDPVSRGQIDVHYANVLLGLGRLREAATILDRIEPGETHPPPFALRNYYQARAELAWRQGQPEQALIAAERALELGPVSKMPMAQQPARIALLRQRASLAAGRPVPAGESPPTESAAAMPIHLTARAEWAAHQGDHSRSGALFREAVALAENSANPSTIVTVTGAYIRWLLDRERHGEALAMAGRLAEWAEHDFDSALLQIPVLRANGLDDSGDAALQHARQLAGEREIPVDFFSSDK